MGATTGSLAPIAPTSRLPAQQKTAKQISEAHEALKEIESKLETITDFGERALKTGEGPAAIQIASQASCLAHLVDIVPSPQKGFDAAMKILKSGSCYESLMKMIGFLKA